MKQQNGDRYCAISEKMSEHDSHILKPHTINHGTRIDDWMKGLDVVIVLESALQNVFRLAHELHVRKCVLVLNMDWTDPSKVQLNQSCGHDPFMIPKV
jgi:hypothetical protein